MDRRKDKCNDIGIEPEVFNVSYPLHALDFTRSSLQVMEDLAQPPSGLQYVFEGYLMNPIRVGGYELCRP